MGKNLGIGWQLYDRSGWGIYGINLALQLQANHPINPILLFPPLEIPAHPLQARLLEPLIENSKKLGESFQRFPNRILKGNLTVLCALGDGLNYTAPRIMGRYKIGVVFLEDTRITEKELERSKEFDQFLTGSSWNEQVLKDKGINNVKTVTQGIDPTIFHPGPKSNFFADRFVIFSGGKLEYRKGQDIVIAAFKAFHNRHTEALLLASWYNAWPVNMGEIAVKGHVVGAPSQSGDHVQAVSQWLSANGLPEGSFMVIPDTPNIYMGNIIREADVGLFTNRAEGGTNLVAMECLASGIPVILSANTGHLDFAREDICLPLKRQGPVQPTVSKRGVDQWGETDVDEAVEALEEVYSHYTEARKGAEKAVEYMMNFTWEKQINKKVMALEGFF